ncbi:hypothetical protein [Brevundimonas sp.]|uniref:hypothetical protein n=1 Tax=Brevundimonas sp. TaxID=1871086 RepID=UPI0025F1912A|nr:hypothetical protein [Brevundimonas sp.]
MDRSRFLAGLIGPTLAAVALSLLINPTLVPEMTDVIQRDFALILIAGVLALLAGLAIVMTHNVWKGWPGIITAFGWLAILGGLGRILFPAQIARLAAGMVRDASPAVMILAVVLLLLGLFLSFQAFRPRPSESPR